MSSFEMIKCDNQECKNTTHKHIMDGWILLRREEEGEIYDGRFTVAYNIIISGETPDKNKQIELPDSADYCCLDCFLTALGLI